MYKINTPINTQLRSDPIEEGEPIEIKVFRLIRDKEPIEEGAPLIYTERKDGVNAAYNIRTDRFEVALDAFALIEKSKAAQRDERLLAEKAEAEKAEAIRNNEGKPQPTAGQGVS